MKRKNLFAANKLNYFKNQEYRKHNCIICKILEKSPEVSNLLVHEDELSAVCLNLYPYNAGHLMVFPRRHIEDIRQYSPEEEQSISALTRLSLDVLDSLYGPQGYNLGYNHGKGSGASIAHLHLHIVPRYANELGFMDIIGGAKLIVENPEDTRHKIIDAFSKHKGKTA